MNNTLLRVGLKAALFLLAFPLGILTALGICHNADAENSRALIYTPRHLLNEAMILLVTVFLIVEAADHIWQEADRSFRRQGNRYARILIAAGILAVHLTVLWLGGYAS